MDTVIGSILHENFKNFYGTLFGTLYGYEHTILVNWVWLFLANMVIASLFYIVTLVINKIGKRASLYAGFATCAIIVAIFVTSRHLLSAEVIKSFMDNVIKGMGIMKDGTVNLLYPVFILLAIVCALSIGSYAIIRRTELKG